MPKQNRRAQEIRDLAAALSQAKGGNLSLPELQKAVAGKWYEGDVARVRGDYLINTLIGHKTSVMVFARITVPQ